MRRRTVDLVLREIPGPAGRLEALLDLPILHQRAAGQGEAAPETEDRVRAAVIIGHPHPQLGGHMHIKGVYRAAKGFTRVGCAVLRFNFRGVGKSDGIWDEGRGELDDFSAAIDFMAARFPGRPLWAAGMSFGAWAGLTVGCDEPRISAVLGIAMPASTWDLEAVTTSTKPKFFIHGERDEICSLEEMMGFYHRAADPKKIAIIEGSDHLFTGKATAVTHAVERLFG